MSKPITAFNTAFYDLLLRDRWMYESHSRDRYGNPIVTMSSNGIFQDFFITEDLYFLLFHIYNSSFGTTEIDQSDWFNGSTLE